MDQMDHFLLENWVSSVSDWWGRDPLLWYSSGSCCHSRWRQLPPTSSLFCFFMGSVWETSVQNLYRFYVATVHVLNVLARTKRWSQSKSAKTHLCGGCVAWIVLCCEVCFGVILLSPTRLEDDRGSPDVKLGILNMLNIYKDANPPVWLEYQGKLNTWTPWFVWFVAATCLYNMSSRCSRIHHVHNFSCGTVHQHHR